MFRSQGTALSAHTGESIFKRGELGRNMFVVESGQVQLEFGDGMPDKLISPSQFFGELALFIGSHAALDPGDHRQFGSTAHLLGGSQAVRRTQARRCNAMFERAVELDPEFAMAHATIAAMHLPSGRYREGIPAARHAPR